MFILEVKDRSEIDDEVFDELGNSLFVEAPYVELIIEAKLSVLLVKFTTVTLLVTSINTALVDNVGTEMVLVVEIETALLAELVVIMPLVAIDAIAISVALLVEFRRLMSFVDIKGTKLVADVCGTVFILVEIMWMPLLVNAEVVYTGAP